MLRILVIEDSTERINLFRRLMNSHECLFARTFEEATRAVNERTYDLIMLDYDLDGESNSLPVARHLATLGDLGVVVIHSENLSGVRNIKDHLPEALVIPFSRFAKKDWRMNALKQLLANPESNRSDVLSWKRESRGDSGGENYELQ